MCAVCYFDEAIKNACHVNMKDIHITLCHILETEQEKNLYHATIDIHITLCHFVDTKKKEEYSHIIFLDIETELEK